MNKKIETDLELLVEKILKTIKVKKIFLFGSHSYGVPSENSDIDMCILTDARKRKIDILREIRKTIFDSSNYAIDLLVYKPQEFYERAAALKSIEQEILSKGTILYE